MLGFERGAGCSVSRAGFGQGPAFSPIWLDNVGCRGSEKCLDDCSFIGLGDPVTFCSHREDAGVICLSGKYTCGKKSEVQCCRKNNMVYNATF